MREGHHPPWRKQRKRENKPIKKWIKYVLIGCDAVIVIRADRNVQRARILIVHKLDTRLNAVEIRFAVGTE
jgi:hypothetical protein